MPEHPLFFLQSLYERACVHTEKQVVEISWKGAFWSLGQFIKHPSILCIDQQRIDLFNM